MVHVEDHVGAATVGQRAQDVAVPDVARGGAVPVGADVADEGVEHTRPTLLGDEAEDERHRLGGLGAGSVDAARGVEEPRVERGPDASGRVGIAAGVVLASEPRRDLRQSLVVLEVDRGGGERDRRELRRARRLRPDVVPVSQAVVDDMALRAACQIGHVTLHCFVIAAQRRVVAGPHVVLPGRKDDRAAPFRGITEALVEDHVLHFTQLQRHLDEHMK